VNVDVASHSVRIRAHPVGIGDDLFRYIAIQVRHPDMQLNGQPEPAVVTWADANVGSD
jgi:hypothetical protein